MSGRVRLGYGFGFQQCQAVIFKYGTFNLTENNTDYVDPCKNKHEQNLFMIYRSLQITIFFFYT